MISKEDRSAFGVLVKLNDMRPRLIAVMGILTHQDYCNAPDEPCSCQATAASMTIRDLLNIIDKAAREHGEAWEGPIRHFAGKCGKHGCVLVQRLPEHPGTYYCVRCGDDERTTEV